MSLQDLALINGIGAKMKFLNHRQRVISQNIANSDTPGYRPQDLKGADFSSVLEKVEGTRGSSSKISLSTPTAGQMKPGGNVAGGREDEQKETYEVAPVGNAVIIEEQLINSQETVMDYNLMGNILRKNIGMINIALGRGA